MNSVYVRRVDYRLYTIQSTSSLRLRCAIDRPRRGAAQFTKTVRSVLIIIISVYRVMQCIIKIDMKGKEVVGDECTYKSRSCTIIV